MLLLQFNTFLQAQVPKVDVITTTTTTTATGLLDSNTPGSNNGNNSNGGNNHNGGNNRNGGNNLDSNDGFSKETKKKDVEPLDEEWHLRPTNTKSVKNMSSKVLRLRTISFDLLCLCINCPLNFYACVRFFYACVKSCYLFKFSRRKRDVYVSKTNLYVTRIWVFGLKQVQCLWMSIFCLP